MSKQAKKGSKQVVKKRASAKASGRNKNKPVVDKHAEQCTICKHAEKEEIEARFMRYESPDEVATEFDLSRDAIYRHARYYGLIQKRVGNTERILELIIERGMVKASDVPVNMIVESVKELHKVRGKHKEPAKNPEDEKARVETAIKAFIDRTGASRDDAIRSLSPFISEVSNYAN